MAIRRCTRIKNQWPTTSLSLRHDDGHHYDESEDDIRCDDDDDDDDVDDDDDDDDDDVTCIYIYINTVLCVYDIAFMHFVSVDSRGQTSGGDSPTFINSVI